MPVTSTHKVTEPPFGTVVLEGPSAVSGGVCTGNEGENSDVLPSAAVAVATTDCPLDPGIKNSVSNVAFPEASVATVVKPRNVWPCSKLDTSPLGWRKNSIWNMREGMPE